MKVSKAKIIIGIMILMVVILLGIFFGWQFKNRQPSAGPKELITIAYVTNVGSILIDIAFVKGYFAHEGLEAIPQPQTFGKMALRSLIEGKADIATTGDTPIVFAVMDGKKINILATIQTSNKNEGIVARLDRGIIKPSGLKGKKIGVTVGTTGDIFLDSFLLSLGIGRRDVKIVDMKPSEMSAALGTGKVDAVSTWNPTLIQLQKQLGKKARIFYKEVVYTEHFCLVAGQDFVLQHPETIKKVLRALIKAEAFVQQYPEEARRLIAEFIRADKTILAEIWDYFDFRVTLDQSLLVDLEEQTRWIIKNKWTARRDMPNYLNFIYYDGLWAVKPEAVRIIR